MTKFILENFIDNPEELKGFDVEGYEFNEEMSTNKNWAFVRN